MPSKNKKRNKIAIKADNVVFGVQVHDEPATIVFENDVVMLCSNVDGSPYSFPADFRVTPQMYGEEVDITIRDITNEVILHRGKHDFYEEETYDDDRLLLIETVDDLQELFNEKKIKMFTKTMKMFSTIFSGFVLSLVCYYFKTRTDFPFPMLLNIGLVSGAIIGLIVGLVPCIENIRRLNSKYIVDECGSFVNMETGKSNLNGGMTFRLTKREGPIW